MICVVLQVPPVVREMCHSLWHFCDYRDNEGVGWQ